MTDIGAQLDNGMRADMGQWMVCKRSRAVMGHWSGNGDESGKEMDNDDSQLME